MAHYCPRCPEYFPNDEKYRAHFQEKHSLLNNNGLPSRRSLERWLTKGILPPLPPKTVPPPVEEYYAEP